jgi:hypothetical protein
VAHFEVTALAADHLTHHLQNGRYHVQSEKNLHASVSSQPVDRPQYNFINVSSLVSSTAPCRASMQK